MSVRPKKSSPKKNQETLNTLLDGDMNVDTLSSLCHIWRSSSDDQPIKKQICDHLAEHRIAQFVTDALSNSSLSSECRFSVLRMIGECCKENQERRELYLQIGIIDAVTPWCSVTKHIEILRSAVFLFFIFCGIRELPDTAHISAMLSPLSALLMFDDENLLCLVLKCYGVLLRSSVDTDVNSQFVFGGGMSPTLIVADYERLHRAQDTLFDGAIRTFTKLNLPDVIVFAIGRFYRSLPVNAIDCDVPRRLISVGRDSELCAADSVCELVLRVVVCSASIHSDFDCAEWIEHGIVNVLDGALRSESSALLECASCVMSRIAHYRHDIVLYRLLDALLSVSPDALNGKSSMSMVMAMSIIFMRVLGGDEEEEVSVVMKNMDAMLDVMFISVFKLLQCSFGDGVLEVVANKVESAMSQLLRYEDIGHKLLRHIDALQNNKLRSVHHLGFAARLRQFVLEFVLASSYCATFFLLII